MRRTISKSPEETKKIAGKIVSNLKAGGVIALFGELGSGKTTFAQGLAEGLGIKERIISPTFVLVREHRIKNYESRIRKLYHIDLYRVESESELGSIGFREILSNPENIVVIEWAEKAQELLPEKRIEVHMEHEGEFQRKLRIIRK
ncbi:MAG: hypothetical protein UT87_C0001G0032 [Candidatus Levybacteria bacterium GW2011_GWC1_40_19]|nr:MAG: hypothetical protein UT46_C0010G0008 [Candidatus Levybacteria bacterium GW2011_GWA1_39_34]KKR51702.1 MAG: hypothetical protein UT87_C0001G0032 [Candidatus Levybacteria bacterium GW2011_GWC1_40_19]KKR94518.1 MAG: hypothetical protein UU45_C0009G0027 [Candidatus Levybacteria bacterium GW2011_GWA2_41_15]KKS01418.1 MAG: hypothetical protein UU52_C0012G0008 [Candidatus Levybacteria bacterium GW2011_GWB1_41_21]OGH20623.1 MAG: tRNA (adenosine(37)-N6)-threonylcarbamoyltransferase complex ATPase